MHATVRGYAGSAGLSGCCNPSVPVDARKVPIVFSGAKSSICASDRMHDMTPISLSTDAYSTVRALQYAEKWKIAFVKPAVQRELTSLGLATVEDDCLVITPIGMTVPRMPEPATSSHLR